MMCKNEIGKLNYEEVNFHNSAFLFPFTFLISTAREQSQNRHEEI